MPKNLLTPFLVAVLACISPAALADTDTEIRAALDFYAEMWNQDDVDALGGYYDSGFVLITDLGRIARGKRLDDLKAIGKDGGDRGTLSISDVVVTEGDAGAAAATFTVTPSIEAPDAVVLAGDDGVEWVGHGGGVLEHSIVK